MEQYSSSANGFFDENELSDGELNRLARLVEGASDEFIAESSVCIRGEHERKRIRFVVLTLTGGDRSLTQSCTERRGGW